MSGSAGVAYGSSSSITAWETISTDPRVVLLTDPTDSMTHIRVRLVPPSMVEFSMTRGPGM